jgi:hypothetical protein
MSQTVLLLRSEEPVAAGGRAHFRITGNANGRLDESLHEVGALRRIGWDTYQFLDRLDWS